RRNVGDFLILLADKGDPTVRRRRRKRQRRLLAREQSRARKLNLSRNCVLPGCHAPDHTLRIIDYTLPQADAQETARNAGFADRIEQTQRGLGGRPGSTKKGSRARVPFSRPTATPAQVGSGQIACPPGT